MTYEMFISLAMKHFFKYCNKETNKINVQDMIKTIINEEHTYMNTNMAYKIKKEIEFIHLTIKEDFDLFYRAMLQEMLNNYLEKGLSYRDMTYEELIEKATNKLVSVRNKENKKFYVDIANYCGMIWMKKKENDKDSLIVIFSGDDEE